MIVSIIDMSKVSIRIRTFGATSFKSLKLYVN